MESQRNLVIFPRSHSLGWQTRPKPQPSPLRSVLLPSPHPALQSMGEKLEKKETKERVQRERRYREGFLEEGEPKLGPEGQTGREEHAGKRSGPQFAAP